MFVPFLENLFGHPSKTNHLPSIKFQIFKEVPFFVSCFASHPLDQASHPLNFVPQTKNL
jgi:hypothetical protein